MVVFASKNIRKKAGLRDYPSDLFEMTLCIWMNGEQKMISSLGEGVMPDPPDSDSMEDSLGSTSALIRPGMTASYLEFRRMAYSNLNEA